APAGAATTTARDTERRARSRPRRSPTAPAARAGSPRWSTAPARPPDRRRSSGGLRRDEDRAPPPRAQRLVHDGRQVVDERRHRNRRADVRLDLMAIGELDRSVDIDPLDGREARAQELLPRLA